LGRGGEAPWCAISKEGDELCRRYLVQAAQYILGPFGPDNDLRRWGPGLIGVSKSKKVKKRAVIAVARKLSVLLLRLWVDRRTLRAPLPYPAAGGCLKQRRISEEETSGPVT
jgi:hypothetical protein